MKAVCSVKCIYDGIFRKIFDPGLQHFFSFLSLNFQDENKLRIDDDIVTAADLQLQEHLTCFRFLWVKDNVTQTSAVR